jgi:hypothetical protein
MKKVTLHKIPLEEFIEILINLWENGADFIDIEGTPDSEQDIIGVTVKDEYLNSPEATSHWETVSNGKQKYEIKTILSDDDLEKLTEA